MRPDITCASIGEGNLLLFCLHELQSKNISINVVFTNSEGSEAFCIQNGIPCYKRNANLVEILERFETDYLFSISNPTILKNDVLKLPRRETINYHDSPLPAYAGVHATSWAIMRGEKTHGISWHVVEVGIDTGDILESEAVDILEEDSALTLNLKCIEAAKRAFERLTNDIVCNKLQYRKQDESDRSYFGLYAIPPDVGVLKFTEDVDTIYNSARALEFGHHDNALGSPKIKTANGTCFIVTNVSKAPLSSRTSHSAPGTILDVFDDTVVVATKTEPIQVSVADLHGNHIPQNRFKDYCLEVGHALDSRFDGNEADLLAFRKKETFWRNKMVHYEPTMFYRQKMNVVASIINFSNKIAVKSVVIDLKRAMLESPCVEEYSTFLQTCFVAFLARINCTSTVHVGILADKKSIPNDCQDLYSSIAHCTFNLDCSARTNDVIDKCMREIQQYKDAGTYLHDMFYRYPVLRGTRRFPHHNIVMSGPRPSSLTDGKLQDILFDCNVLLFFGDKNGTELQVMYHERPAQDFSHITDVLQHFSTFLNEMSDAKESQPLQSISLVTSSDMDKFYAVPGNIQTKEETQESLAGLVDKQCQLTPMSIAIKSTTSMMTYNKLSAEINALANKITERAKCARDCSKQVIGIHMPNSIAYTVTLLAVVKSEHAFLPLPIDLPADRIVFTLKDAMVRKMLMTKEVYSKCDLNGLTPSMSVSFEHQILDKTVVMVEFGSEKNDNKIYINGQNDYSDIFNGQSPSKNRKDHHDVKENDFLYLMYTSGSTGRPKGVKVKESGVINLSRAQIMCWDLVPGDVIAQFASIGFDASISEIFTSILSGSTLAVLGSTERLGSEFVSAITKMKASVITLPPSALNIYSPDDLPTLKKVVTAGEACTLNIANKWTSHGGIRFFNAYGPTEGTVCATCYEHFADTRYEDVNRELPIGRAIDGVQVYIFDAYMHPVPPDVVGELCIGGKGLAHGYIGHASHFTKERFVQNPLVKTKSLLYKTGDHAFQDSDGNITYVGRTDDQVKIRGNRIDLSEIEQVLIQHPKVEMAVVVVHKCSSTSDLSVAAYVAPTFIYISELREYLAKVIPKYMMPTFIQKLEVKDFPQTVNGKINRKKLEQDEIVHDQQVNDGHSHLNDMQLTVARLWCRVFKFDESFVYSLHRQSSFSELGGNSLQLVLLMRVLEDEFNFKISFTDLGSADTLEEFSDVIRRRRDMQAKSEIEIADSVTDLRTMIYHDSELDSNFVANPERRRSIHLLDFSSMTCKMGTSKHPKNILLSGVTGFLGAFLLSEIMEQSNSHVCCMVRETTETRGIGRIIENMRNYGLWKFEYAPRIAVVLSDLSLENLGIAPDIYKSLCNAIDVVFMNAAMMNFNTPYEDHRVANVIGTKEFIRFATTGVQKYLFTTSSLSVFLFPDVKIGKDGQRLVLSESDFMEDPLNLEGGYAQSKWASERLVLQALDSLPGGAIFRPARVSGQSIDGVGPKNDLFASIMLGMSKMGSYPDMDFPFDLTPVDFCAKAMIEITLKICNEDESQSMPRVYHLFNRDTIEFRELFDGMDMQPLPLDDWRCQLRKLEGNKELLPLTPFFMSNFWDRAPDWPIFDTANTDAYTSNHSKGLLKSTKELLPIYKRYFGL
ncbi:linear gramicidin synthase subunit D-like [Dreissena polymorpha]|uniref:Carrier domain-containing protein n=1 Tax=Dreissena polymorpha TaxID=45954 RepID=A0A9D4R280_DREPO|nr:linear gramicidin synthase subunit D-like [Dreissena polymorpha]KAH3851282.1 hypothetical protein DPMN_093762 [Dreissena polymorpha]